MRVAVRNLGIIEQVEIDLKPMTIFVGPNNSENETSSMEHGQENTPNT